jgi:hypothetical protein
MSNNGKAGSGRGNRKRPFRRRDNSNWHEGDSTGRPSGGENKTAQNPAGTPPAKGNPAFYKKGGGNDREERLSYIERPKWIPPKTNTDPMPVSDCPWCGKPIRDMSTAIADKDTGSPVHFDCVTARIAFGEKLEKGEYLAYIGGGRFGVISFGNNSASFRSQPAAPPVENHGGQDNLQGAGRSQSQQGRSFIIKKIIEWESKDRRAEWRSVICDHYSVT